MIYTLTLNPALDRTIFVDKLGINKISRVQKTTEEAGGKGFNVSRALLRVGTASKAIGLVGGSNGRRLLEGLEADGLEVLPVPIAGETRVNQVFQESPSRSIKVNDKGPVVSEDEYCLLKEKITQLVSSEDIWIMSGSLPVNVPKTIYADLTKIIQAKGGKVFLDSSGEAFQEGLNIPPQWIKPNLSEARAVFSDGFRKVDLLEQFQQLGVVGTILTMGGHGLLFSDATTKLRVTVPPIENENVVGAGDATVAGFVYGLSKGHEQKECAMWAAAFGVASAHAPGNCFEHFAEVEKYYQQLKVDYINE